MKIDILVVAPEMDSPIYDDFIGNDCWQKLKDTLKNWKIGRIDEITSVNCPFLRL
jgi:hypothetical protein